VSLLLFESGWFPFSRAKIWVLRLFGARIGAGMVLKPFVRIKYPWKLHVGAHCWIGQDVWIDNLADVRIGDHVCISQGAYLCTGSHDYRSTNFDLLVRTIDIEDGVWVAAKVLIIGGVIVGRDAVLSIGSVVKGDVRPGSLVSGNPAQCVGSARPNAGY